MRPKKQHSRKQLSLGRKQNTYRLAPLHYRQFSGPRFGTDTDPLFRSVSDLQGFVLVVVQEYTKQAKKKKQGNNHNQVWVLLTGYNHFTATVLVYH